MIQDLATTMRDSGILKAFGAPVKTLRKQKAWTQKELPRRALALVLEWAAQHRAELREDWELCEKHQQPKKIQPLD